MKSFGEWCDERRGVTVCEASLTRMIEHMGRPFAVITAYKSQWDNGVKRTREDNIAQNRELRGRLNARHMGAHQLVGHWRECSLPDTEYEKCPPDKLVDVIERSYFVPMPEDADLEDFRSLMVSLGREFKQNAIIVSDGRVASVIDCNTGSTIVDLGRVSLNKIGQGYSQHILKQNVPFVFEGFEQMHGNIARMGAARSGLLLPPLDEAFRSVSGVIVS